MRRRNYFAQGVSLGLHLLGLLAVLFLLNPPGANSESIPTPTSNERLIYVASTSGLGRRGGGSQGAAPPAPMKVPAPRTVSVVPVVSAAPADPLPPALNAPVMTDATALLSASGVSGSIAVPRGGGGPGTGLGPGAGPGIGPGSGPGFGDTGLAGIGGIEDPIRIREVRPEYTAAALQARVQGPVEMQAVLDATGKVVDVRVTKSLDRTFGLDDAAKRAAYATPFRPCKKDGKPVACVITFALQFTLR